MQPDRQHQRDGHGRRVHQRQRHGGKVRHPHQRQQVGAGAAAVQEGRGDAGQPRQRGVHHEQHQHQQGSRRAPAGRRRDRKRLRMQRDQCAQPAGGAGAGEQPFPTVRGMGHVRLRDGEDGGSAPDAPDVVDRSRGPHSDTRPGLVRARQGRPSTVTGRTIAAAAAERKGSAQPAAPASAACRSVRRAMFIQTLSRVRSCL